MDTVRASENVASLTEAQRQYLRLVASGMTSKQIAQKVGGSHHTINVQIGIAMRILGATSRHQAAVLLDTIDRTGSYEASHEPPAVADPVMGDESPPTEVVPAGYQHWPIPVATKARPTNTLSAAQRIAWVLVIATVVALLLGGLISGIATMLTSLGRLG